MYFVYTLRNTENGKIYIGVSNNPKRRLREHQRSQYPIGSALRKYGVDKFTMETVEVDTVEEALDLEQELVGAKEVKDPMYYNVCLGGIPGQVLFGNNPMFDPEIVKQHPALFSSTYNPMHNPESKQKMIDSQVCKKVCILGVVYYGVREAAREIGISRQCLVHRLKSNTFPEYNYS